MSNASAASGPDSSRISPSHIRQAVGSVPALEHAKRAPNLDFLDEQRALDLGGPPAFISAGNGRARLETPAGGVAIALDVSANAEAGTVERRLEFPDGGVGVAQSRVSETTRGTCIYSFVLHAPPRRARADRRRA